MGKYFTDIFNVDEKVLSEYGAFNISLINDLPLFIDPFLLFNSPNSEYQGLHAKIIEYLIFLRDNVSNREVVDGGMLSAWFMFPEVKQAWLGFCQEGNAGSGLGIDFAKSLFTSLQYIFNDFGNENISKSAHLEKLCLIKSGVGKDNISDFTANLIKDYLAEYTQEFTINNIDESQYRLCTVDKAVFNYDTQTWEARQYNLPYYDNDYILLTPIDILRREDTWINRNDMISGFEKIPFAISDDALRFEINNYFYSFLSKKPTQEEKKNATENTIRKYPQIIDYYIKQKEDTGDRVYAISEYETSEVAQVFVKQVPNLIQLLTGTSFYAKSQDTFEEAMERVNYLKSVIEDNDGYRVFYYKDKPIQRESDLHVMFRLVCFGSESDVNSEVNNGRGAVDFKLSKGSADKTLIEFKLASNRLLKRNLQNQVPIYEQANNTKKSIKVILYFSEAELQRVTTILNDLKLSNNIVLIDARNDNKPSASTI